MRVPRLVTVQIGAASKCGCGLPHGSLCAEELFSLIGDVAELGIGAIRFSLQNALAVERLCRAADYARRRGVETTISLRTTVDLDAVGELAQVRPAAIAVCLRVDEDPALANAIRRSGVPLEIETDAAHVDVRVLPAISERARTNGAQHWRVDFSGVRLGASAARAAAEVLISATSSMTVIVHALDAEVRREVIRRLHDGAPVPDLRRLHHLDPSEELVIAECGDVASGGSVRAQTLAALCARPDGLAMRRGV